MTRTLTYRVHLSLCRISERACRPPLHAPLARNTLRHRILHEISWANTAALERVVQADPMSRFMDGRVAPVVVRGGSSREGGEEDDDPIV